MVLRGHCYRVFESNHLVSLVPRPPLFVPSVCVCCGRKRKGGLGTMLPPSFLPIHCYLMTWRPNDICHMHENWGQPTRMFASYFLSEITVISPSCVFHCPHQFPPCWFPMFLHLQLEGTNKPTDVYHLTTASNFHALLSVTDHFCSNQAINVQCYSEVASLMSLIPRSCSLDMRLINDKHIMLLYDQQV